METKESIECDKAVGDYVKSKKGKAAPSTAVIGFIKKNRITGKTSKEIDALIENAVKLRNGVILGEGDKFYAWCVGCGRVPPDDELVAHMNRDPFDGALHVRKNIPTNPSLWRSWCTYRAGKGRGSV
jgi:hypothetical protein